MPWEKRNGKWEWRPWRKDELEEMAPAPQAPIVQPDAGPSSSRDDSSLLDGLTSRARQLGSFLKRLALGATEAVGHAYSALMNDVLHLDDLTAWWLRKTGIMPDAKPEDFEFQILGRKRSEEPRYISEGVKEAAELTGQVLGSILPVGGAAMTGGRLAGSLAQRALRESPSLLQRIGTAAATGAGTGLAYGAYNELMDELGDPERESLKEHLQDIGKTTALFGAYGAVYPYAQRAVEKLGSTLPQRVRERLSTLGERAPEVAQAGRGALEGALAGAMVGSGIGAYELLKTGDPQQALAAVTGQAKEEAAENIVQGIAFGIAQRLLGRGRVVNPLEVADRVKQKVAEKAPEAVTPEVVQEVAREVEAEYEQAIQQQEAAPAPQVPQVTVQKPSVTVEPQQEQAAVQQPTQQPTIPQKVEAEAAVEQKPAETAPAPTKTAQVVEVNPGDMVELRGLKDRFTVVSKERSGLIRVRSEKGGETTVHQAAVARVVKPAEQEMIQPAVQVEPVQDTTAKVQVPVETVTQPEVQEPPAATVNTSNASVSINKEKNFVEIKFARKPSKDVLDQLKKAGFRWYPKGGIWYHKNTEENLNAAKQIAGIVTVSDNTQTLDNAQTTEQTKVATTEQQQVQGDTKLATHFRKLADNLQSKAEEIRNKDRKVNTPRRAQMAASALAEADRMDAIAAKMRALADAAEAGTLPETLRNVRTKAQVEDLYIALGTAKWDAIRANAAQDDGKPVTEEQIMKYAQLPKPVMSRREVEELLKWTEGVKGTAKARKELERLLKSNQEMLPVGDHLQAVDTLVKAADKKKKQGDKDINTRLIKARVDWAMRLSSIFGGCMPTLDEYRKLLVDFLKLGGHVEGKTLDRKIKEMELELVGRDIPGYFPTPKPVVEKMLEKADIQPGMKVLEPSAGKGNIADAIKDKHPDADLEVVEYEGALRKVLEAKGHKLVGVDFLQHKDEYDRIVMNPPFEKGQDIDHVRHAYELLKPGGRLVAIMSEGAFSRGDKKATAFREWLEQVGGTSEKLPEGSFKSSERPTGVATRLVVIDKPAEARTESATKQEEGKSAATQPAKMVFGKKAVAKTERGTSVETEYAVVNATDLLTSHDTNLRPVKEYPQELQPRDRSRAASEEQINRIVAKLEPEFLAESPKASEGAPIVGPDLVVESGNARTIALKKAYETKHENAEKYRKWLLENAERFGLDRAAIEKMEAPVLVRIRRTDVDRAEFAREANEQSVAAMSATEQALADAKKISGKLMSLFVPDENGNILTRENRDFVTAFFRDVVGPAERARYMTSDGSINQEGINRIRNAVFAKAYGDPAAIEKLAESPDNNVRNITNAMLVAAPRLAKIKEEIEQGNLYDLDITSDLAAAMRKLSELREQGVEVKTYLNQLSLFGDDLSPFAKDLLEVLDEYKRSAKKINALLQAYADVVEAAGNPKQLSLFKDEPPTKAEVLEAALRKVEKEDGATQTSLFENQSVGDHGASAPANSVGTRKGKTEAGGTKREGETGTEEVLALAGGWYPRRTQVGKRDDGVQVEMGIEGATAKKLPEGGTDVRLTPRAARDIADIVAKHLDTVVRVGRLQTPGAKGEYLPRAHAARVKAKHTQDWRVVGHELGHALRTKTGFVGNPQELAALAEKLYPGKVPAKLKVEEGFAEFFQLWVTDPKQAQKLAPRTYEAFEELIGQDPALKDVFDQVRVAVHEDVAGTPLQRALRSIVFPGEKPGKATAGNEYEMNRWKRFKSAVFDSTVPLQDLFNEAAKKGFEGIDGAKLAALAGGARERAIKMFERRATDHLGRYIAGRPLQEIANEAIAHIEKTLPHLKDVDEASGFRIFNAIMYAYRYRERAERGHEKNPIDKKDAEELIKWAKEKFGDKIEELVKEYTSTFSKIILTKLERAGLITPEIRARIEAGSDWYIPTYYATRAPYVSGQVEGGRTVKQPVKRYEGRQEQVYDFMTASLLKLMEVEQAIEYKRVLNAIEEALKLPGMGKFGEFINPPVRMVKVSSEQLARQVEEFLNDVVDEKQIGDKVFNLFIPEGLKGLGKNEPVVVNRHGDQMVYMRLAPDIYNALVSMKPEQVNGVARMLAKIASIQRYLNITNFRYLTNAIARDLFAAGIQKQGAHNILKGTIRGALLAAGKDPQITDAYIASGAFLSNVEDVLQSLRRASVTDGLLPTEAPGWKRSAKGFFYRVFRTPGEVLRWQEQTQRFPEFVSVVTELAKKHGIDPKIVLDPSQPIPEGKEKVIEKILVEGGYAASEVTVNFNRRGRSEFLRTYGAAVPFLHGTLQGLYRFGREISNPQTRSRALWRTMLYTIPITIAAWMAMRDEGGEDIPSEMRDRYWIFPIPGTRYRIAIAKPYEYAVMANVLERYLDWVYRENDAVARKPLEDLGKMLKQAFLPPYKPQWLDVIMRLRANETELGSPIVPRGEQGLSPDLQYGPSTSALSQAITRAWMRLFTDKAPSPRQIDFFIEQMFGGLGRAITAGSDVLLGKKELADLFADGSKVPIIGRLLYDPTEGGSRIMDRFYSDWEKVQRLNQSAEKWAEEYLRTNKKPAGVDKLTERDILMLMAYPVYNKYSQLLSDMRKELQSVESDPNLSAKEKMQYRMRMTYYQKLIAGYLYGYVPDPPKGLGITQQEIEDFLSLLDQLGNEALLNEQKRKGGPSEHAEMIQLLMQAK